jgi:hypothetical protein
MVLGLWSWDLGSFKDQSPKTEDHSRYFITSLTIAVNALSCSVLLRGNWP